MEIGRCAVDAATRPMAYLPFSASPLPLFLDSFNPVAVEYAHLGGE
jgi:hypothetical protein